jgi:4-hydroxyacetophenone monooxygenase
MTDQLQPSEVRPTATWSAQLLADAIAIANIPTLLMVLVQLTGDHRWIRDPYRPSRAGGMGDNDSGGLDPAVQAEIRAAALAAITQWHDGAPVALPEPEPALLVEMLSWAMGETVPPEYGRMTGAQLGLQQAEATTPLQVPDGFHVLIIGGGVSGMCAAVSLQRAGVPFTILEKHTTVGGVWWENRYPGAGVDTPNHLYSYSFAPYDWTQYFALRDELHAYLEHVADQFQLRPSIRFGTEVRSATYDVAEQRWVVQVCNADGEDETLHAPMVFSAIGIFNPLKVPDIAGLDTFAGQSFHTGQWPADIDLTGKRVAIIGNGASAMQVGPEIQDIVQSLTIFQRSPQWAAPFEHFRKPVPDSLRFLLREVPLYRAWYRVRLGWTFNDRVHPALQKDPSWQHPERSLNAINDAHREFFTRYIRNEVGERTDLLEAIVPTYPPFGKRMLMDNGWYRMLTNERVELVTDSVASIGPDRVITNDGREFEADVLVLATGFDVLRFISTYEITGRSGRTLRETWDDDNAKAYLGLAMPDFPNLFVLYGPNTQPGHGGSLIFVIEMQLRYIMDLMRQMFDNDIAVVECRQDVHDDYNAEVDRAHENMVWTHPGMQTYYRNARGRVVVNMPYRNVDMFERTLHADLADFVVEHETTESR